MATWSASLSVGHPEIDAQHRELFARADDLIDAMMAGRAAAEMEQLFVFLRDYCRDHFSMEEKLMVSTRYLLASSHVTQHREFQRQFQEVEDLMAERGATSLVVLGTKDLIRGWLVNHVSTVDLKLANHLTARGASAAAR
jgi:hemerythrin